MTDRPKPPTKEELIKVCQWIAYIADGTSVVAGVAGDELAGQIVSVASCDPEYADTLSRTGSFVDASFSGQGFDPMRNGCLSYTAGTGEILYPSEARAREGSPDQ